MMNCITRQMRTCSATDDEPQFIHSFTHSLTHSFIVESCPVINLLITAYPLIMSAIHLIPLPFMRTSFINGTQCQAQSLYAKTITLTKYQTRNLMTMSGSWRWWQWWWWWCLRCLHYEHYLVESSLANLNTFQQCRSSKIPPPNTLRVTATCCTKCQMPATCEAAANAVLHTALLSESLTSPDQWCTVAVYLFHPCRAPARQLLRRFHYSSPPQCLTTPSH